MININNKVSIFSFSVFECGDNTFEKLLCVVVQCWIGRLFRSHRNVYAVTQVINFMVEVQHPHHRMVLLNNDDDRIPDSRMIGRKMRFSIGKRFVLHVCYLDPSLDSGLYLCLSIFCIHFSGCSVGSAVAHCALYYCYKYMCIITLFFMLFCSSACCYLLRTLTNLVVWIPWWHSTIM